MTEEQKKSPEWIKKRRIGDLVFGMMVGASVDAFWPQSDPSFLSNAYEAAYQGAIWGGTGWLLQKLMPSSAHLHPSPLQEGVFFGVGSFLGQAAAYAAKLYC